MSAGYLRSEHRDAKRRLALGLLAPAACRRRPMRRASTAELWEMTEAVADALQRAELRVAERLAAPAAGDSLGALGSMAWTAELGGAAETAAVTVAGLEAETVLTATAIAALTALAARSAARSRMAEWEALEEDAHLAHLQQAWRAVLRQHPEAV